MKTALLIALILFLVGCEGSFKEEKKEIPQKSEYWLSCAEVADYPTMNRSTSIIRCENKEVICYWETGSMQCKFKDDFRETKKAIPKKIGNWLLCVE